MLQNLIINLPIASTLDAKLLREYVGQFFNHTFNKLNHYEMMQNEHVHALVMTKVTFVNGETRSLSDMRKVNRSDRHLYAKNNL